MTKQLPLAFTLALALTACGGGGGGGGGSSVSALPLGALTAGNQNVAAQDSMSGPSATLTSTSTLTGAQTSDMRAVYQVARDELNKFPTYLDAIRTAPTLTGAVASRNLPCTYGGYLAVSGTDADNNGIVSAGDSVTITGVGCREAAGTISGTMAMSINSVSGNFGTAPYSGSFSASFAGFAVSTSTMNATLDGSMTLSLNQTDSVVHDITLSASSLRVTSVFAGVTRSITLTGYSARDVGSLISGVASSTVTFSGNMSSSALNLSVDLTTTTPFVQSNSESYPHSGVLLATGAKGSKLRITALSNSQVQLELDENGDGTYEKTTPLSWNSIL